MKDSIEPLGVVMQTNCEDNSGKLFYRNVAKDVSNN